jgi:hypothetical protein
MKTHSNLRELSVSTTFAHAKRFTRGEQSRFYRKSAYCLVTALSPVLRATKTLHKAIERDPGDSRAHYVLAAALSANELEKNALAEYRRGLALPHRSAYFLSMRDIHFSRNLPFNRSFAANCTRLTPAPK